MFAACEHGGNVCWVQTACQQGENMQSVNDLLDAAKKAQNLDTDMALAKALGVGRAAVSAWRHGGRLPDPVACATLAGLTGEPLGKVLGIVGEARAISSDEKAVWRKLAATAMTAFILVGAALPGRAQAAGLIVTGANNEAPSIHYANFWYI